MSEKRARERLEYKRRQVARDMDELDGQVEDDQVESDTAERLRWVYEEELTDIDEALSTIVDPPVREVAHPEDSQPVRGFSFAQVARAGAMLAVLTGLIIWAGTGSGTDPSGSEDSSPLATVEAGAIDIGSMSDAELEDALASFPESAVVRLALADRHLAQGDQQRALEHYLVVVTGEASPQDKSRALARVGYLSYATGQHKSARETLLESLYLDEDNTEAMLYLGYVLLNGFGDEAAAIPYFERVIADPSMPPEVVEAVSAVVANARGGQG